MPKVTVPDEQEQRILRENKLDPDHYGVTYRDDKTICLLCYDTRDEVTIRKGDRPW
ncbi:MAG: hypothetical protein ACI3V4_02600 [Faecousia sp.]